MRVIVLSLNFHFKLPLCAKYGSQHHLYTPDAHKEKKTLFDLLATRPALCVITVASLLLLLILMIEVFFAPIVCEDQSNNDANHTNYSLV